MSNPTKLEPVSHKLFRTQTNRKQKAGDFRLRGELEHFFSLTSAKAPSRTPCSITPCVLLILHTVLSFFAALTAFVSSF